MKIWKEQYGKFGHRLGLPWLPTGELQLSDVEGIREPEGRQRSFLYKLKDGRVFRVSKRIHIDILAILQLNGFRDCVVEVKKGTSRTTRRAAWTRAIESDKDGKA